MGAHQAVHHTTPIVAAGAMLLTGCIDTDPAVFVDASILAANATVAQETLVTTIEGSCLLGLHLGPRASGPAEIQLGAVSVTNADQTATLVDVLSVSADRPLPVSVPVDSDVNVSLGFDAQDNLLETATYDALCGAATIVIRVALDDSLRGGTTTVASAPFAPAGCP